MSLLTWVLLFLLTYITFTSSRIIPPKEAGYLKESQLGESEIPMKSPQTESDVHLLSQKNRDSEDSNPPAWHARSNLFPASSAGANGGDLAIDDDKAVSLNLPKEDSEPEISINSEQKSKANLVDQSEVFNKITKLLQSSNRKMDIVYHTNGDISIKSEPLTQDIYFLGAIRTPYEIPVKPERQAATTVKNDIVASVDQNNNGDNLISEKADEFEKTPTENEYELLSAGSSIISKLEDDEDGVIDEGSGDSRDSL